jgi:hypothetical protein
MSDYEIIPERTPRSRLDHPSVGNLIRRLIHELQRQRTALSTQERAQLARLRSLVDALLQDDDVQID